MKLLTGMIWIGNGFYLAKLAIDNDNYWLAIPSLICFILGGFYGHLFDKQLRK
jgi:hypothetical protein